MRQLIGVLGILLVPGCGDDGVSLTHDAPPATVDAAPGDAPPPDPTMTAAARMIEEGRHTFRFDTFGDEAFWGGVGTAWIVVTVILRRFRSTLSVREIVVDEGEASWL